MSPWRMEPINVVGPVCVRISIGITVGSTHDTSNGCCKVNPGGVAGSVTVILKPPVLMIVNVTILNPVKDSGSIKDT